MRPRADVLYFRREQSPPIPERFLEFLYLTKISYRERIMNHDLGVHEASGSPWCLPSSYQPSTTPNACLSPTEFQGKTPLKNEASASRVDLYV